MAWLTGWNRRKQLSINGSSTSQSLYQMKITVNYGSGTDGTPTNNIYCNSNCKTDFSDIRFTDSGGSTQLNYWIESYTASSNAKMWVQIPSIPTGSNSTSIYIYYNNPSATTTSNGTNTFIFFDDFNDTSYTNKWTLYTKCTYATLAESGGILSQGSCYPKTNCTGGASSCAFSSIYNSVNVVSGTAIQVYIPSINSEGWQSYELDFGSTGAVNVNTGCGYGYLPNDCYRLILYPGTIYLYRDDNNSSTNVGSYSIGVQGLYILVQYNAPNITVYTSTDNQTWTSRISYSSAASKTGLIWLISQGCGDRYGLINWDNLYVRTFTSPEPTWSTVGTEQSVTLNINSTPTGATVYLRTPQGVGSYISQGVTTNTTIGVVPGTYDIKLTLPGYQDWYLLNQSYTAGQSPTISATLILIPGSLAITSTPSGASVYINSILQIGITTPATITGLNPSPPSYNVTLRLIGYQDWSGNYDVITNSTTNVTATFAPSAYISSIPSGASIYIDGILQGQATPATITNLSVGSHTYKFVLIGYNVESGNFGTIAGQTTNISRVLSGTALAFLSAGD